MLVSEITQALVRLGVVTHDAAVEAEQRCNLYGGGIDTALLETRATDEETLTTHLGEVLGIPVAPVATLGLPPDLSAAQWMDGPTAQRLGAAPRRRRGDVLDVFVRPEHDHDGLVDWAAARALLVEPALVCEARFRAHLLALYEIPLPPRHLALLASLVGPTHVRVVAGPRAQRDMRTPTPVIAGVDPLDTLLEAARLGDASARRVALRRLSRRLNDPRVAAYRRALLAKAAQAEAVAATGALRALAELRDKNAVPAIIELLEAPSAEVASAAHATLVALTCEDLGPKPKRWTEWWDRTGSNSRVEWLLAGLGHRAPELRLLASSELYEISGEYFGYHYDLPERDREEARQRWIAWWQGKDKSRG